MFYTFKSFWLNLVLSNVCQTWLHYNIPSFKWQARGGFKLLEALATCTKRPWKEVPIVQLKLCKKGGNQTSPPRWWGQKKQSLLQRGGEEFIWIVHVRQWNSYMLQLIKKTIVMKMEVIQQIKKETKGGK